MNKSVSLFVNVCDNSGNLLSLERCHDLLSDKKIDVIGPSSSCQPIITLIPLNNKSNNKTIIISTSSSSSSSSSPVRFQVTFITSTCGVYNISVFLCDQLL